MHYICEDDAAKCITFKILNFVVVLFIYYQKNVSSELETCKGLRPSIATQTEPDAVLVQTQDEVSALSELNTSLKDDVDGLNYKV